MDTEELAPQLVVQIELMEHLAGRLVRRRAFVDEFRSRLRISAVLSRDVGFERLAHHVGHPAGIRGRFGHHMLHEPRRARFRNGSASAAITPRSREMPLVELPVRVSRDALDVLEALRKLRGRETRAEMPEEIRGQLRSGLCAGLDLNERLRDLAE